MEVHYIIEAFLAIGGFMVGIIVKRAYQSIDELWRKHDEMTERLTSIAVDLPKNYVTKNDLLHAIDIVHDRFDKLEVKLESYHQKKFDDCYNKNG
jgi:dimeric dUTPase (all-alpha-NTP-PPase superfamily)